MYRDIKINAFIHNSFYLLLTQYREVHASNHNFHTGCEIIIDLCRIL